MPRPKANPAQHLCAYRLWREGKGQTAIYKELDKQFGDEAVSERTVGTWIKRYKSLDPETVDLDAPFEWHQLDKYGLPWEAGAYMVELLYLIETSRALNRDEEDEPNPRTSVTPLLSVREALWCWRVHRASPEIGEAVGNLADVLDLGRLFAGREELANVLGEPLYMEDLEALLVYKPWLDFAGEEVRHQAYHQAVGDGAIPALHSGRVAMVKKFVALRSAANLKDGSPILSETGKVALATLSFSKEHPELLTSQQLEIWMKGQKKSKAERDQADDAKKDEHDDEA